MTEQEELLRKLVGQEVLKVEGPFEEGDYEQVLVKITTTDYLVYFVHHQDCCENVYLEDYSDLQSLVGETVTRAEATGTESDESECWCTDWYFYKIRGNGAADVTLRFCGEHNGYYSTEVTVVVEKR